METRVRLRRLAAMPSPSELLNYFFSEAGGLCLPLSFWQVRFVQGERDVRADRLSVPSEKCLSRSSMDFRPSLAGVEFSQ